MSVSPSHAASSSAASLDNEYNGKKSQTRRNTVLTLLQWIESLTVPTCCSKRLPETLRQNNRNDGGASKVYILTGLERVLFGTQPAAEVVKVLGLQPPRYLCYMVSGMICDILQFAIDFLLFLYVVPDASTCWALSFGLSIVFRHTTHRYLVFGDYVGGYWKSLGRMYAGYSIIIVLSTLFNIFMTKYIQVPHAYAWIITLLWTGIVNYFILKKLWSFGGSTTTSGKTTAPEQELSPLTTAATTTTTSPSAV
ncbi:GtrA-like protein [Nitzschia inconspicua]|uniref:GtrA-like protein n=1 Tax=Nitzschia inconspicua TaxID=303405 RepID=A0A9K3KLH0_9STRA|nr:GtrA-like protein [Nitzschia inconspicua]